MQASGPSFEGVVRAVLGIDIERHTMATWRSGSAARRQVMKYGFGPSSTIRISPTARGARAAQAVGALALRPRHVGGPWHGLTGTRRSLPRCPVVHDRERRHEIRQVAVPLPGRVHLLHRRPLMGSERRGVGRQPVHASLDCGDVLDQRLRAMTGLP